MSRLTIHRGAKDIGGSCVEIQSASGERLIIDLGAPLDDDEQNIKRLPKVDGLLHGDPSIKGILLSHAHASHFGLLQLAHESIPVFMSDCQKWVLNELACHFTPGSKPCARATVIKAGNCFSVGTAFRVQPMLLEDTVFSGFSYLVEIDGTKRVLYSGDFRGHGRPPLLDTFCKAPPRPVVDALLMDGALPRQKTADAADATTAAPEKPEAKSRVEKSVPSSLRDAFTRAGNRLCTVMCSGHDAYRLAAIASAARATGRTLVVDFYTAQILLATQSRSFLGLFRSEVGVYIPIAQRIIIKKLNNPEMFSWVRELGKQRVYLPSQAREPGVPLKYDFSVPEKQSKFVFLLNADIVADLSTERGLLYAQPIFSMWDGYWNKPKILKSQKAFVRETGFSNPRFIHTPGHALPKDIRRYTEAVKPRLLVPIHTEPTENHAQISASGKTRPLPDQEWLDL